MSTREIGGGSEKSVLWREQCFFRSTGHRLFQEGKVKITLECPPYRLRSGGGGRAMILLPPWPPLLPGEARTPLPGAHSQVHSSTFYQAGLNVPSPPPQVPLFPGGGGVYPLAPARSVQRQRKLTDGASSAPPPSNFNLWG